MPSNFIANVARDLTLPAGVATTVDIALDGARDWTMLLANTGANPVTAGTIAYSPLGTRFTDAEAFPAGIPLAAAASLPIVGTSRPLAAVRLVLTSALGTTARIEGGGR